MRRLRERNDENGMIDKKLIIQLLVNYFKVPQHSSHALRLWYDLLYWLFVEIFTTNPSALQKHATEL